MIHLHRILFYAGAAATFLLSGAGSAQLSQTGASAQTSPATSKVSPASGSFPTGPGSLQGTWVNANYKWTGLPAKDRVLAQKDGTLAPLQPWAREAVDKRVESANAGRPYVNTLSQCLPGGVPEMDFGASEYAVQILETPGQVTMLYDEQNHFRIIRLNQPHLKDPDPSYMGDSVGHWEGDTLVIDTIALKDKTTLDMVGTPHSDQLHVVERLRRVAPNRIETTFELDDPKTFSKPWIAQGAFKTASPDSARMDEYICEQNPNLPTTPR